MKEIFNDRDLVPKYNLNLARAGGFHMQGT